MSSGANRVLPAFSLAANTANDRVLSNADFPYAALQDDPTFVEKENSSENLMITTIEDSEMFFMYYSPTLKRHMLLLYQTIRELSISLESSIASVCSKYYRITDSDM